MLCSYTLLLLNQKLTESKYQSQIQTDRIKFYQKKIQIPRTRRTRRYLSANKSKSIPYICVNFKELAC